MTTRTHTIQTQAFGPVTFEALPDGRVYTDLGLVSRSGALGWRIYRGGRLNGWPLRIRQDDDLKAIAVRWWSQARRRGVKL